MEKPWLAHYEPEVPHTIDYPKMPLHQILEDGAAPGVPITQRPG